MRGLRTIPVMIEMGNEMAERCPDGLLLNYTNPMAMVPWGVWAGSRVAGRAHDRRVPQRPRHPRVPRRDGRGAPRSGSSSAPPGSTTSASSTSSATARPARTCTRGCARSSRPTPRASGAASASRSSGASATSRPSRANTRANTCPWFLHHDDQVERFRAEIDEYVRRSDENLAEWAEMKARARCRRGARARAQRRARDRSSSWPLETGAAVELYGNVRNDGLIDGLPEDACVEVPMRVDGERCHAAADRRDAAAVPGAEPDVPQRRRAHRARRRRGVARARLPGGAPRPEHRRHAQHRADRRPG